MLPASAAGSTCSVASAALVLITTLSNPSSIPPVPVLEVIKVFGHLASSDCYGFVSSGGSSCQLPLEHLIYELGLTTTNSISQQEFSQRIKESQFQWPLKPYGIEKSLTKTATMNTGAETRVYMEELERRGLYDKRNPTGPLPTSLRPKLNEQVGQDDIDPVLVERTFAALNGETA
jgi:hypothetical protein